MIIYLQLLIISCFFTANTETCKDSEDAYVALKRSGKGSSGEGYIVYKDGQFLRKSPYFVDDSDRKSILCIPSSTPTLLTFEIYDRSKLKWNSTSYLHIYGPYGDIIGGSYAVDKKNSFSVLAHIPLRSHSEWLTISVGSPPSNWSLVQGDTSSWDVYTSKSTHSFNSTYCLFRSTVDISVSVSSFRVVAEMPKNSRLFLDGMLIMTTSVATRKSTQLSHTYMTQGKHCIALEVKKSTGIENELVSFDAYIVSILGQSSPNGEKCDAVYFDTPERCSQALYDPFSPAMFFDSMAASVVVARRIVALTLEYSFSQFHPVVNSVAIRFSRDLHVIPTYVTYKCTQHDVVLSATSSNNPSDELLTYHDESLSYDQRTTMIYRFPVGMVSCASANVTLFYELPDEVIDPTSSLSYTFSRFSLLSVFPSICSGPSNMQLKYSPSTFTLFRYISTVDIRPVRSAFSECTSSSYIPRGMKLGRTCSLTGTPSENGVFVIDIRSGFPVVSSATVELTVLTCLELPPDPDEFFREYVVDDADTTATTATTTTTTDDDHHYNYQKGSIVQTSRLKKKNGEMSLSMRNEQPSSQSPSEPLFPFLIERMYGVNNSPKLAPYEGFNVRIANEVELSQDPFVESFNQISWKQAYCLKSPDVLLSMFATHGSSTFVMSEVTSKHPLTTLSIRLKDRSDFAWRDNSIIKISRIIALYQEIAGVEQSMTLDTVVHQSFNRIASVNRYSDHFSVDTFIESDGSWTGSYDMDYALHNPSPMIETFAHENDVPVHGSRYILRKEIHHSDFVLANNASIIAFKFFITHAVGSVLLMNDRFVGNACVHRSMNMTNVYPENIRGFNMSFICHTMSIRTDTIVVPRYYFVNNRMGDYLAASMNVTLIESFNGIEGLAPLTVRIRYVHMSESVRPATIIPFTRYCKKKIGGKFACDGTYEFEATEVFHPYTHLWNNEEMIYDVNSNVPRRQEKYPYFCFIYFEGKNECRVSSSSYSSSYSSYSGSSSSSNNIDNNGDDNDDNNNDSDYVNTEENRIHTQDMDTSSFASDDPILQSNGKRLMWGFELSMDSINEPLVGLIIHEPIATYITVFGLNFATGDMVMLMEISLAWWQGMGSKKVQFYNSFVFDSYAIFFEMDGSSSKAYHKFFSPLIHPLVISDPGSSNFWRVFQPDLPFSLIIPPTSYGQLYKISLDLPETIQFDPATGFVFLSGKLEERYRIVVTGDAMFPDRFTFYEMEYNVHLEECPKERFTIVVHTHSFPETLSLLLYKGNESHPFEQFDGFPLPNTFIPYHFCDDYSGIVRIEARDSYTPVMNTTQNYNHHASYEVLVNNASNRTLSSVFVPVVLVDRNTSNSHIRYFSTRQLVSAKSYWEYSITEQIDDEWVTPGSMFPWPSISLMSLPTTVTQAFFIYIRQSFSQSELKGATALRLFLNFHGGVAVYWKGVRKGRINLHKAFKTTHVQPISERKCLYPSELLIPLYDSELSEEGNALAIEIHNPNPGRCSLPFTISVVPSVEVSSAVPLSVSRTFSNLENMDPALMIDRDLSSGLPIFRSGLELMVDDDNLDGYEANMVYLFDGFYGMNQTILVQGKVEESNVWVDVVSIVLDHQPDGLFLPSSNSIFQEFYAPALLLRFSSFKFVFSYISDRTLHHLFDIQLGFSNHNSSLCHGSDGFPSVEVSQISTRQCPQDFYHGYQSRECLKSQTWGPIQNDCIVNAPTIIQYESEHILCYLGMKCVIPKPTVDTIEVTFDMDSPPPPGLVFSKADGGIEGIPLGSISDVNEVKVHDLFIFGENLGGATEARIQLDIQLGFCPEEGIIPQVYLYESITVSCSKMGLYMGSKTRNCVLNPQTHILYAQDSGHCVHMAYTLVLLGVMVVFIITATLRCSMARLRQMESLATRKRLQGEHQKLLLRQIEMSYIPASNV